MRNRLTVLLLIGGLAACIAPVTPAFASSAATPVRAAAVSTAPPASVMYLSIGHDSLADVSLRTAFRAVSTPTVTPTPQLSVGAPAPIALHSAYRYVVDTSQFAARSTPKPFHSTDLIPLLVGFALIGAVKTVVADKDTNFTGQSVRAQFNALVADFYYFQLNGVLSTTVATLPLCARGGTATKAKTTNATVLNCNGVAVALAATDDYWTLTGAALAASSFRRYLLLSNAAGVASVQASTDAATAAACTFAARPAAGVAIVGILTVATDTTHTFTPATTALNAAGITSTFIDGVDDSVFLSAQVTP